MNNQKKFTTRSNKLKVHRTNSQTMSSCSVRFPTDVPFSSLFSFAFCFLVFFRVFVREIKNIYSDTHSTMQAGK